MSKEIRLVKKGGAFTGKVRGELGSARVKSLTLVLDWWEGPGDDRLGDRPRAVKGGFEFEVRHGRARHLLGPVERDLRLEARLEAPEGVLEGETISGNWTVRQSAGEEPVQSIRIELKILIAWGKGLATPDLRVERIWFEDLEPEETSEGSYPLKRDYPQLVAGKSHAAKVHLWNRGAGDAREPEVAMFLTGIDGKNRRGLPPAQVLIVLRENEDMRVKWEMPVPRRLAPGLYLLHAIADPKNNVRELDEENNAYSRVIRVMAAE
jgi:hypothetical protein